MSTTTVSRAATIGMVGGALWALLPVAWSVAELENTNTEPGTPAFVAVVVSYWIFAVLPPALIIVGMTALRRPLGFDAGRAVPAGRPPRASSQPLGPAPTG